MNGTTRTHIDLFSGIGGFALAARWAGVETVAFCEIEKYAQRVLRKNFPGIRILEDVRSFPATEFRQPWLLTGGYPCQPFSQAGKRRGTEDDRHLWPEMFRIIRSSRPVWVLCENVAGHISMGLDEVISDLEGEEYSVQSFVIPALSVDAKHRRDRVWIVANNMAHTESLGHRGGSGQKCGNEEWIIQQEEQGRDFMGGETQGRGASCGKDLADSKRRYWDVHEAHGEHGKTSTQKIFGNGSGLSRISSRWLPEPDVGRVAHGIPNRVDRLKGLGNAIVPQVAYQIIRTMIESEEQFIGEQHENQP